MRQIALRPLAYAQNQQISAGFGQAHKNIVNINIRFCSRRPFGSLPRQHKLAASNTLFGNPEPATAIAVYNLQLAVGGKLLN